MDGSYIDAFPDRMLHLSSASTTPDQTITFTLASSVSGTLLYGPTQQPAAGMSACAEGMNSGPMPVRCYGSTDKAGKYTIEQVPPGNYCLELEGLAYRSGVPVAPDWTAVGRPFAIKAGQNLGGIDLILIHGAVVKGVVTNKDTGRPASRINVSSYGPDHPVGYDGLNTVDTNSDGKYSIRVALGDQTVFAASPYTFVIGRDAKQTVTLAEGDDKTLDFSVVDPGSPEPVGGIVYAPDGKPAVGAVVHAIASNHSNNGVDSVTTDSHGHFAFDSPGLLPGASVYATSGTTATVDALPVDGAHDMALHLAAHGGFSIAGRVIDTKGLPVDGVDVELYAECSEGGGEGIDSTKTDASGNYLFPVEYRGGKYTIGVTHDGYLAPGMRSVQSPAGEDIEAPAFVLTVASSFVGGKVVDSSGAPVSGALVTAIQMGGLDDLHTTTDAQGRFHLEGVPAKQVILDVRAPENRTTAIVEPSGRDDDVIAVTNQAGQSGGK